nr:DUF222 domain-containing protein [Diaminobutyricimonas sp. LJ205]
MAITQTFDPLAEDAIDLLRCASDDELLAHTAEIEAYGRRVDALRVVAAAEVAHRSRRELEGAALSAQKGCRNASELLQRVTGAAGRTVESWMRLGAQLRGRPTLIGIEGPADFPAVTVAVTEGRIGVDVATAIVTALAPTIGRAHPEDFAAAEQALVTAAGESTADSIRVQAAVWQAAIDPDGVEPSEERAMARRGIRLGRARDGLIPISGGLMPEAAGALSRLFDAHLTPRTAPAFLSAEERDAQSLERDPRTPDQQRHDVFMGIVDSAARAADAPSIGGAAPTVLVSVRADDLDRGGGAGYIDGVEAPVSIRAVGQKICAGGSQRVVIDPTGRGCSWAFRSGCSTPSRGGRSVCGTADVSSRTVRYRRRGPRFTMSWSGRTAEKRIPTTECCCVGSTIGRLIVPGGRYAWFEVRRRSRRLPG